MPTLWQKYSVQLGKTIPPINALVISKSENCIADDYKIEGLEDGSITIDQLGMITIDSSKAIPETQVKIYATLGGNKINVAELSIEVYDCSSSKVTFPSLKTSYVTQIDDPL